MSRNDRIDVKGAAILVGICLIWGGAQPAIRIAAEGISPVFQAGLRSVASALLLMLWCLLRGRPFLRLDRSLAWGLLLGLVFTAEFTSQYIGLTMTDVSRGVLFIFVAPFVAALGAHLLVPQERLTGSRLLGLGFAFLGLCLAFWKGLAVPDPRQLIGDVLCLIMGILWGIDTLIVKLSPLRRIEPERVLFYCLAISAPGLLALSWLMGEPGITAWTPRVIAGFAYSAVFVSFISYVTLVWLIRIYPAASIGSFMFLSPIFGVALAGLLLGEALSPLLLAALALNALGIWLVNRPARGLEEAKSALHDA